MEAADLAGFEWLLVVAVDDVEVAGDFLANLIAPSGPDVEARRRQVRPWRAAIESSRRPSLFARLGLSGPAVPQGDQLRRTRQAVATAIESINRAVVATAPIELAAAWESAQRAVDAADLNGVLATIDSTSRRVTPDDVTEVSRRLQRAARGLLDMRRHVALARLRSTEHG